MPAPTSTKSIEDVRAELTEAFQELDLGTAKIAALTRDLGSTRKETIFTDGTLKLQHYYPQADELYRVPVLIVYSLVNQPYILDLAPGQSLIEFLLRQGFDVYMIEWGRPRSEHTHLRMEDYVLDRIPRCVAKVVEDSGEPEVSIIGYCIGGLLAVMYAALHPDGPLKNLVCLAAPIDSDGLESLKKWMESHFDEQLLIDTHGNVPPDLVQNTLRMLRPFGKVAGQMNLLNNLDKEDFVTSNLRFAKWESDNVPFPAAAFKQLVNDFLRGNKLIRNEWELDGKRIDLGRIRVPLLHLLAEYDHITPYAAAKALVPLVGSADRGEIVLKGGHVGLVAGRSAVKQMWPALVKWLGERSV
jgi:polyhydroxyalkanoate synthase subunit PhaC